MKFYRNLLLHLVLPDQIHFLKLKNRLSLYFNLIIFNNIKMTFYLTNDYFKISNLQFVYLHFESISANFPSMHFQLNEFKKFFRGVIHLI